MITGGDSGTSSCAPFISPLCHTKRLVFGTYPESSTVYLTTIVSPLGSTSADSAMTPELSAQMVRFPPSHSRVILAHLAVSIWPPLIASVRL